MPVRRPQPRRAGADRDARAATSLRRCSSSACSWSLAHAYDNVPHYRREVRRRGRAPARSAARSPTSRKFPFTDQGRPARQLSVRHVRRAARAGRRASTRRRAPPASRPSSATRANDIDTWATVMARSIRAAGGRAGDIVHVAYGYGLFTGGLGAHYGAEKLGCTVIPMSRRADREAGAAHRRLQARHHHGDAVVHAGDRRGDGAAGHRSARRVARDRHLRRRALDADDARRRSRRALDIDAIDIYGLSEVIGPGRRAGMHRDQGRPHGLGGPFLSGDHRSRDRRACCPTARRASSCSRRSPRRRCRSSATARATSRGCCRRPRARCAAWRRSPAARDDMLIIRGVNVFPTQIEELILQASRRSRRTTSSRSRGRSNLDEMTVLVERAPARGRGRRRRRGRAARALDQEPDRRHRRRCASSRRAASSARSARRGASSTSGRRAEAARPRSS